jgi:hypothetical protein
MFKPGEKHWHGASPDNVFVHLAITAKGGTHWDEPVTDTEFEQGSRAPPQCDGDLLMSRSAGRRARTCS